MIFWNYLTFAIIAEISGTVCLKLSNGFENLSFAIPTFALYGISFWLLALSLKGIELGIAYAIWAGVGTAVVAVIGIFFLNESTNLYKILCIVAIVIGVVGLHLAQKTAHM